MKYLSATHFIGYKPNVSTWIIDTTFIIAIIAIFYSVWMGSYSLFTPDEGRYSEVAREMVLSGDYIVPRSNGVIFMDKPILYYWLQAIAIKIFGLKEWALRFWPASIGVLGCFATYIMGRILFNRRTGIISAAILAVSPLYYGASHYANLDLEVAVFISISLLLSIAGMCELSQAKRISYMVPAYIFAGLAILTKGLMGLVFPAAIIGIWIIALRRWQTIKKLHLVMGAAIILGVTAPWFIAMQKANHDFFYFFFYVQHVLRFFSVRELNSKAPFWFYIPILVAGFFPWSLFFLQSIYQKIKNIFISDRHSAIELFLLIWVCFVFLFFSVQKTKTLGYILSILPAMSLLVGCYLSQLWEESQDSIGYRAENFCIIIAFLIIGFMLLIMMHLPFLELPNAFIPYLEVIAGICFIASIIVYLVRKEPIQIMLACLIITVGACLLTFSAGAKFLNYKTVKPLALHLNPYIKPDDEIISYHSYFFDLPIYLNLKKAITVVYDWNDPNIINSDNWKREFWYGMPYQDTKSWLIRDNVFWQRWKSNRRIFIFLKKSDLTDFTKIAPSNVYNIAQHNDICIVSNKKALTRMAQK